MVARLNRRDFLRAAGLAAAALGAAGFQWAPPAFAQSLGFGEVRFPQTPRYEELRALIDPATDVFECEKQAAAVQPLLDALLSDQAIPLAADFQGDSPLPDRYQEIADGVRQAVYQPGAGDFASGLAAWLNSLGSHPEAEFAVLAADRVRYEVRSRRPPSGLEFRVGHWRMEWTADHKLRRFEPLDETVVGPHAGLFRDITPMALWRNEAARQFAVGIPEWRERLDSTSGIDVYGQNGISVADIDNDGWDEIYVCQPGGLPNRLLERGARNLGFADITEKSGLGLLDATSAALFADFRNIGRQDAVIMTGGGPLLYLNNGDGTFIHKPDAFRFAAPPGGTFTSMAAADYDGDGKLDLYCSVYIYFQSEDQYSYPAPYHDARNGPPNFLFRNALAEDGSGAFEDVTAAVGLDENNDRYSFAASWCDYDLDGRPELYVANDFGLNNLYKFDGRRFRDIAAEAGVEDIGPGMSVSWFDYDGDGLPDLYVTNMWSPSGQRVIADPAFAPVAEAGLEDAYRRHSKGNTLYRNRGDGTFEETGEAEMGRWSWSGEGIDFDADGSPEILVAAGMLTAPRASDSSPLAALRPMSPEAPEPELMSFFWRQVVAQTSLDGAPSKSYEEGWNAINQYIRERASWNGRERNVFYARKQGRYVDVSGVSGLDFARDSRAFAAVDFDGDGRLDLVSKNRLAPQVSFHQNTAAGENKVLILELEGVQSNRDAVGAWVVVECSEGRRSTGLFAGSGYLCQHTKRLHIGLGKADRADEVAVHWPSGAQDKLTDLEAEAVYRIVEGKGVASKRALAPREIAVSVPSVANQPTPQPDVWLIEPVPLPEQRPAGLLLLGDREEPLPAGVPGEAVDLHESPDLHAQYTLFHRYLRDFRGELTLPVAFLIDERARAHKIYYTPPDREAYERDIEAMQSSDRLALALPYAGRYATSPPSRNYFRHGAAFYQAGCLEQALPYLEQVIARDPRNFKSRLALGQINLSLDRLDSAAQHLTAASELRDDSPELWNNLGGLAMSREQYADAARSFEKAIALDPGASYALANLGLAYDRLGRASEAETLYRRALAANPADADAADRLGLVLAKQNRLDEAKGFFQKAIESQRDHASAINNLAVLYLKLDQPSDAEAALRYGLSVAPGEERLYLNLARLYVQQGARDKARGVMEQLLAAKPDSTAAHDALERLRTP